MRTIGLCHSTTPVMMSNSSSAPVSQLGTCSTQAPSASACRCAPVNEWSIMGSSEPSSVPWNAKFTGPTLAEQVYDFNVTVSPLMQALYERRQADVDAILATNPELDVFEAAALGSTDRLSEVLAGDPTLATAWSSDGFTALHFAAFLGTTEAGRMLLDAGADPAAVARNDMLVQPLHSAAAGHNTELCRLLLERGAPVNGQQQQGYTALDEATMTNQDDLRDLLLEHGADPTINRRHLSYRGARAR